MKKLTALCLVLAAVLLAACAAAEPFRTESGVTFGMTEQEITDLEAAAGREMKGPYQDRFATWIWFAQDIRFDTVDCSSVQYALDDDGRMYMVCYTSRDGETDYSHIKEVLTARYGDPADDPEDPDETGGISLLYSHKYEEDGRAFRVQSAHWGINYGKYALGIDLWYTGSGVVSTVFYDASSPASCDTTPTTYSDESGISFPYMERWLVANKSTSPIRLEFYSKDDGLTVVDYTQMDFRRQRSGQPDEVFGMDYLDHTMVYYYQTRMDAQNLRTEFHNGTEYRVLEYEDVFEGEVTIPFRVTVAMTLQDGIFHMFRLSTPLVPPDFLPDFEALLDSVTFEK